MKKVISMILVLALVLCGITAVSAAEGESIELFNGEHTLENQWQAFEIYTTAWGGSFSTANMSAGGAIVVTFTGEKDQIELVLNAPWTKIAPSSVEVTDAGNVATFTYEDITAAYTAPLSEVGAICPASLAITAPLVIKSVVWVPGTGETEGGEEEEVPGDVATVVINGSEIVLEAAWSNYQLNTNVWGGSFNVSNLVPGGAIHMAVSGQPAAVKLALNAPWIEIAPSATTEVEGGYVVSFTYEDIVAAYGSDFSGLGAIYPYVTEITEPVTVYCVTWAAADVLPEINAGEGGEEEEVPEEDPNTVVLFEGEFVTKNAWDAGIQVNTNNNDWAPNGFDVVNTFVPGSYFTITYTGTAKEAILVFMDWDINKWIAVAPIHTEVVDNKYFVSYYSYRSMQLAYGSSDFSGVDAVCAGSRQSTGKTVVTNVSWTSVAPDFSNPNTGDVFSIGAAVFTVIASGLGLGITVTKRRGE